MTVIIIEDELPSCRRLERMLSDFNYDIVTTLVSVKSAIKWFKTQPHPDILFLDIQLSDGLCFEIFKTVNVESVIVFTTAFSEYSIKAFDYNSISYLLKPIQKTQLQKAIQKANRFYNNEKELSILKKAIEDHRLSLFKNKFAVKVGKRIKLVPVDDIECFFSSNNATHLRANAINYIVDSSLMMLYGELNPSLFFQTSRKFIVNINAIEDILSLPNSRLKLILRSYGESEVVVSRERVKAFKEWIGK